MPPWQADVISLAIMRGQGRALCPSVGAGRRARQRGRACSTKTTRPGPARPPCSHPGWGLHRVHLDRLLLVKNTHVRPLPAGLGHDQKPALRPGSPVLQRQVLEPTLFQTHLHVLPSRTRSSSHPKEHRGLPDRRDRILNLSLSRPRAE